MVQIVLQGYIDPVYGIAFSPDEKYLYVGNWDEKTKVVMRCQAKADGTLAARGALYR